MAELVPLLIDENTDLIIGSDYDPLLKGAFEEHIQITERINPGRRRFNNIPEQITRDVHVTGLVLYWGREIKKSRLRVLIGRNNIENLSLYADTVVVDTALQFPQANVTIRARRLIIGKDGSIDTAPQPFAKPAASGGTAPDKMKRGEAGDGAGDLTLLVQSCTMPDGKVCFFLKGSAGQNGEKGGLRDRKALDASKVPVTWDKIKDEVLSHDRIRGDESNFNWPPGLKRMAEQSQLYHAKLSIRNILMWPSETVKTVELGDSNAQNIDNGRDAYASGDGGDGGRGGALRAINVNISPACVALDGGPEGRSELIAGEPKKANSTRYRESFNICHTKGSCTTPSYGMDTTPPMMRYPGSYSSVSLNSTDGKSARGKDGKGGAAGTSAVRPDVYAWLHPFAIETVVQYARNAWLIGDRKPARWLLPMYQTALAQAELAKAAVVQDLIVRNLNSDIQRMLGRVRDNLDYFGNPVGWVPRLSAVSNIDILKKSRPAIAKLLHYAGKLTFENDASQQRETSLAYLVEELNREIDDARKTLVSAQNELTEVKTKLDDAGRALSSQFFKVKSLEDRVINELKQEAQEQAIFTGAFKLAGGLCHFIPVGQPYVGEIGSGLFDQISKIDIHAKDPFAGMKTTGKIAEDLGGYITTYKKEITSDLNSTFETNISSAKGKIDDLDDDIAQHKTDLASCKKELEVRFGDDLSVLRGRLDGLRSARTIQEATFYDSNEYSELVRYAGAIEKDIAKIENMDSAKKKKLQSELAKLGTEKKELVERVGKWEAKKKERGEGIEKTAKYLERVGKGISGVADGLQSMMTPVDEKSAEFRKKLEEAKNERCKTELKELFEEIDKINARRLAAAQRLIKLEAIITGACQTLSTNLIQVSQLSDERAEEAARQLQPMTRLFLRRMVQDTWELLRAEMYYLAKSYQYRFLRRADPELYNVETLIGDIDKFFTKNGMTSPEQRDFSKAFDSVIQGLFLRLALELLTKRMQRLPDPQGGMWTLNITPDTRTIDGRPVLHELSRHKRISFRLHELGPDSKGTGEEHYYRLRGIEFTDIRIDFSKETKAKVPGIEDRISLRITLAHSGDSIIRDENGDRYFFTTRGSEPGKDVIQNVRSWGATYNGSQRLSAKNGIVNDVASTSDAKLLSQLLLDFEQKDEITYDEHLPGATSVLTLSIEANNLGVDLAIEKLVFDVGYEVMPAVMRMQTS